MSLRRSADGPGKGHEGKIKGTRGEKGGNKGWSDGTGEGKGKLSTQGEWKLGGGGGAAALDQPMSSENGESPRKMAPKDRLARTGYGGEDHAPPTTRRMATWEILNECQGGTGGPTLGSLWKPSESRVVCGAPPGVEKRRKGIPWRTPPRLRYHGLRRFDLDQHLFSQYD